MFKKVLITFFLFNNFLLSELQCASFSKVNTGGVFKFFNKSTGKYETTYIDVGSVYKFDNDLAVFFRACYKSSSQDEPENIAFLQISKIVPKNDKYTIDLSPNIKIPDEISFTPKEGFQNKFIFSGWLFSSSPSINTLVDIIYEISLIKCYYDN